MAAEVVEPALVVPKKGDDDDGDRTDDGEFCPSGSDGSDSGHNEDAQQVPTRPRRAVRRTVTDADDIDNGDGNAATTATKSSSKSIHFSTSRSSSNPGSSVPTLEELSHKSIIGQYILYLSRNDGKVWATVALVTDAEWDNGTLYLDKSDYSGTQDQHYPHSLRDANWFNPTKTPKNWLDTREGSPTLIVSIFPKLVEEGRLSLGDCNRSITVLKGCRHPHAIEYMSRANSATRPQSRKRAKRRPGRR